MNKQVKLQWLGIICLLGIFILQSSLLYNQTSPLRWLSFNLFLLLICYIVFFKTPIRIFSNYPTLFLLIFICIQCFSFFYSLNNTLVLPGIQNALFLLFGITSLPHILKNDDLYKLLLKIICIVCLTWNIFGIYDFINLSENLLLPAKNSYLVASLFGNKNIYASAILLCSPLLLIGFIRSSGNWRLFYFISLSLNTLMIVVLQTLSVWIASLLMILILAIGLLAFIKSRPSHKNTVKGLFKKWIYKTIPLLIVIIVYLFYINTKTEIQTKMHHTIDNDTNSINSVNERFFLWNKSYEMIQDHPLLGVGSGNWKTHINSFGLTGSSAANGNVNYASPHNDLILILSENGIIGIIVYLLFIGSLLIHPIKNIIHHKINIPENSLLLAGIIAFYCYSLFEYPLSRPEHVFLLTTYISLLFVFNDLKSVFTINSAFKNSGMIVLTLLFVFNLYWVRSEYFSLKINEGRFKGQWKKVITNSKKINDNYFDADATVIPIRWYEGIAWFNQQNYQEAHICFLRAYKSYPFNLHVINNLASTYSLHNNNDSAVLLYKKALSISDNFDEARINYCIVLFNVGKREECLNELKKITNNSVIKSHFDFFIELIDPQRIKQIKTLTELKENMQLIR